MDNPLQGIFFTSYREDEGYAPTITNVLRLLLERAEELYGARDRSYTILGIELIDEPQPQIYYYRPKYIVIQITQDCFQNLSRAIYQAAHEAIHCLQPNTTGKTATVLEEGVATHFAKIFLKDYNGELFYPSLPRYKEAEALVEKLLDIDSDVIKKLRAKEPSLSRVTKELMQEINPAIPEDLAKKLTVPLT